MNKNRLLIQGLLVLCLFIISCHHHAQDELDCPIGEKWLVASETVTLGNGQKCFLVKRNESKVWELFEDAIEGFDYIPGNEYTIIVSRKHNNSSSQGYSYYVVSVRDIQVKESEQIPLFNYHPEVPNDEKELLSLRDSKEKRGLKEGEMVLQGDMIIDEELFNEKNVTKSFWIKNGINYWSNNTVYYTYGSGFTGQSKVAAAILEWENSTSLSFVYGTGNGDYIEFIDDTWNHSYVGKQGGKQQIGLVSSTGSDAGTAMHEIGHAVGLEHEHCRYDRNSYVIVHTSNIDPSYLYAFDIPSSGNYLAIGGFDFSSIMMYASSAFSINGSPSMTLLDGITTWNAQRSYLSSGDVDGVAAIYGPPYHKLSSTRTVTRDVVQGIYEYYEYYDTYTIKFYESENGTNLTTTLYPRPITFCQTENTYNPSTNSLESTTYTYTIVVPAGCSSYSIGNVYSKEYYAMSNPTYGYITKVLSLY